MAHFLQLCFLVLVEEPHIDRTYGKPPSQMSSSPSSVLYDAGHKPGTLFSMHIEGLRLGDFSILGFTLYVVLVGLFFSPPAALLQAVLWKLVQWTGLGFILWNQSRRRSWTRYFERRGRTLYEVRESFIRWSGACFLQRLGRHLITLSAFSTWCTR